MSIKVEKATLTQLDDVMKILTAARALLKSAGSPQWANNDGPSRAEITKAIKQQLLYVLSIHETVVGTAVLSSDQDPAYTAIHYGTWQTSASPYHAIHRFAIDPAFGGKGFAKLFLQLLIVLARENGAHDIRIDTHPHNRAMQRVIKANDFEFKGIVMLPIENGERYAYQKILA